MRKLLWSYWEGETNDLLLKCINSWKKYLPDWQINILNENTVKQYNIIKSSTYEKLSATTKSDVIRLSLLYNYGGLWMDATILLLDNLDWLQQYDKYPYFGFIPPKNYIYSLIISDKNYPRHFSSWFIYVPQKKEQLIYKWITVLNDILELDKYEKHVAYNSPCTISNNYFMIYQSFCYLVDTDKKFANVFYNTPFLNKNIHDYSSIYPYSSYKKLIKFGKDGRFQNKYLKFPIIYIILLISIRLYFNDMQRTSLLLVFLLGSIFIFSIIFGVK